MLEKVLKKYMQPIIKEAQEEAYKKGAEDVIRRFAFVYETVAQTAKADAYAKAGAVNIEEITPEEFDTIAESGERTKGWEYI